MSSDTYAVPNKLPAKQVSVLTHRKRRLREEASHHHVKRLNRTFKLRKRRRDYKKPEFFINQFRRSERDSKRMRRCIYSNQLFAEPTPESSKLLVAMRHRAHKIASDECQKILKKLGLGRLHNTVLLKNDVESLALLKLVEPYVTYGYPTIQTVRDLIFKHGFLRINRKKEAINSNQLIEENLGKFGIICIEDIIHELFTVSENFKNVKSVLLPFALKPPRDGWSNKTGVSYKRGGEFGNRGEKINALIERCL